ncbi:beta-ketoacyl-ACP synthase [[Limnothrix rosea] IAM M-220]|uniref:beta-ketoacyl-ACP synthase n=1 Tax=[Limnothrix rosea] IAM M-220 TaxID=454133 RepID=UPI0028F44246|nr:beta-ketoacyl-ACP synthase [[Limnothrix rosea] IAM M-220]
MRVVVTGMGLCSGLGNLSQSWQALLAGKTAIRLRQPFSDLLVIPVAMLGKYPLNLESWRSPLVNDVLVDAKLTKPLKNCAVVVGSSRGFQGKIEAINQKYRGGNQQLLEDWLELLPQQLAIATARQIGSAGSLLAPMGACTTGLWALCQGFELLRRGDCERVLVGAIESPITRLSIAGFQKMGAMATQGCFPFDKNREGLVLGEGGAMLMLETFTSARRRKAKIYGEILGWSFTCDAYHVSAPQKSHLPAQRAIAQCLTRANLTPNQVDHIHPHGTSTKLNDQAEAQMIAELFPHRPWVSGSKGATGHSLGASGIMSAAFSLMMLRSQTLFPCVGLRNPEFDLNFVWQSQPEIIHHALCLSFGFGGQNGAIALRFEDEFLAG